VAGAENATTLMERHRQEAEGRLAELRPYVEEAEEIEGYLDAFKSPGRRRTATRSRGAGSASSGNSTTRRRRRSNGPDRHDQFLAVVEKEPGLGIPQIAERINAHLAEGETKVSATYLYRVRDALMDDGKIEVEGDGFKAVEGARDPEEAAQES
jgi:hypothetical protein